MSTDDALLLKIAAMVDHGVMADDWTPDTLSACESMLAAGLLSRGEQIGTIRVYHATARGRAALGYQVQ